MTGLEQKILDFVQDNFPVDDYPYKKIAEAVSTSEIAISEQTAFEIVEGLRSTGVIRRLGGVYDTKRLGLISRLCAGKIPESGIESFARAVLLIPAITHNYIRSHEYNVWFTVIAESNEAVQDIVDGLCLKTDLHDVHSMSARQMFKINTVMRHGVKTTAASDGKPFEISEQHGVHACVKVPVLMESDRNRICLLSGDIPHSLTPFADLSVPLADIRNDLALKRMRRFGAVLRHQEAGFPSNAMVCFKVVNDVEKAGLLLAQNEHVSHCYERESFEGFPYNLYAMFHARNDDELMSLVNDSVLQLLHPEYAVLHSVRELKKTSYKYFV